MNDKEFKELYESSFEYGKEIVHPIINILENMGSITIPKISGFSTSFDFEKNEIHITISLEKAKTLMEKQRDYWREVIEKNDFAKEVTELINKIGVAEFTAKRGKTKGGKKPTPCGKKEGDKSSSTQFNKHMTERINKIEKEGKKHPHGIHEKLYKEPVAGGDNAEEFINI